MFKLQGVYALFALYSINMARDTAIEGEIFSIKMHIQHFPPTKYPHGHRTQISPQNSSKGIIPKTSL